MTAEEAALLAEIAERPHVDASTLVRILLYEEAARLGVAVAGRTPDG